MSRFCSDFSTDYDDVAVVESYLDDDITMEAFSVSCELDDCAHECNKCILESVSDVEAVTEAGFADSVKKIVDNVWKYIKKAIDAVSKFVHKIIDKIKAMANKYRDKIPEPRKAFTICKLHFSYKPVSTEFVGEINEIIDRFNKVLDNLIESNAQLDFAKQAIADYNEYIDGIADRAKARQNGTDGDLHIENGREEVTKLLSEIDAGVKTINNSADAFRNNISRVCANIKPDSSHNVKMIRIFQEALAKYNKAITTILNYVQNDVVMIDKITRVAEFDSHDYYDAAELTPWLTEESMSITAEALECTNLQFEQVHAYAEYQKMQIEAMENANGDEEAYMSEMRIVTEGVMDKIKDIGRKVWQAVLTMVRKASQLLRKVMKYITGKKKDRLEGEVAAVPTNNPVIEMKLRLPIKCADDPTLYHLREKFIRVDSLCSALYDNVHKLVQGSIHNPSTADYFVQHKDEELSELIDKLTLKHGVMDTIILRSVDDTIAAFDKGLKSCIEFASALLSHMEKQIPELERVTTKFMDEFNQKYPGVVIPETIDSGREGADFRRKHGITAIIGEDAVAVKSLSKKYINACTAVTILSSKLNDAYTIFDVECDKIRAAQNKAATAGE